MPKVFISYAREDTEIAMRLYNSMKELFLDPWIDQVNLKPGENWQLSVNEGIRECDYFIAVLSHNSINKRGYVQKELRKGIDALDEFPDSSTFLIPARIENCFPINERLREIQWVDLFPDFEHGFGKLLSSIAFQPGTADAKDISNTRWLFADYTDFDRDVCDWIEFFQNGRFNIYNAREGNWVDDRYVPRWKGSGIQGGRWYQTGNGLYMAYDIDEYGDGGGGTRAVIFEDQIACTLKSFRATFIKNIPFYDDGE